MGIRKQKKTRLFERVARWQYRLYVVKPAEIAWLKENDPGAKVSLMKARNRYEWDSHIITFTNIDSVVEFEAEFIKSHANRR